MKNREKFAKEILDIACKGDTIAVTKDNEIVRCDDIPCRSCIFDCDKYIKHIGHLQSCGDKLHEWAESEYVEYVEKPTITSREKKFLDVLLPKWNYIARDSNNSLFIYPIKPIRLGERWMIKNDYFYRITEDVYGDMFNFITWESDKESWLIEDLKQLEVKDE